MAPTTAATPTATSSARRWPSAESRRAVRNAATPPHETANARQASVGLAACASEAALTSKKPARAASSQDRRSGRGASTASAAARSGAMAATTSLGTANAS